MDADTRRRALAGELGPDTQRHMLAEIAGEIAPAPSMLTGRQKITAIIIAAILVGSVIALAAVRLAVPASLRRP